MDLFNKIGILNDDGKLSITNGVVYIFVLITAFKILFTGLQVQYAFINWKVQDMDVSTTLPLLFSLLNYGHKRQTLTNIQGNDSNASKT